MPNQAQGKVSAVQAALNVIWKPIPNSSQEIAIDTRCHHTLFCGSRGPGKTATQLMRFRRRVGIGYGAFWRGVIFDREYDNLSDLIAQSKKLFGKFDDGAVFLATPSMCKWVWPTGEELLFRHVKKLSDYEGFHGHEYPFIGWNELTKQPNPDLYDKFMSCNRSSFRPEDYPLPDGSLLPPIPLEVFSTCNPNGAGHMWVKRRFIDVAPYGHVVRQTVRVFDPKLGEERDVTKTQVAIFGSYKENPYLDADYIVEISNIKDYALREAWLRGNWEITTGGALDDLWSNMVHVVPRFKIPSNWYVDRTFDWGSTHPFSVGWWAEANGEEIELPVDHPKYGRTFCPTAGSLIRIGEWYGTKEIGTNKGLKLSARNIAIGIRRLEDTLIQNRWVNSPIFPGAADNQIRNVNESETMTLEQLMEDEGVTWLKSDKSRGSRAVGLQLMRDRLENSLRGEGAGLYTMQHCRDSIALIPGMRRDEDEPDCVDSETEDHIYDEWKYRVLQSSDRTVSEIRSSWGR